MTKQPSRVSRAVRFLLSAAVVAACSSQTANRGGVSTPVPDAVNTLTAAERAAGWRLLFDGATTAGWRGYRKSAVPDGWRVVDGALTRTGPGGDIITTDQFGNFELSLQWKISPAGNSGIMYHVIEGPDETYMSGPEMQVLDDERHPDGKSRLTSAGAAYGLYPSPPGIVRPAGEWNTARLVVNGSHVEHWLNGTQVASYEFGSSDWEQRVKASKFVEWPTYGRSPRGHIALQDHGDWVAYRSIKVRER